jgi:HAD superfamily hydrolase (TIGR01509 family)
VHKKQSSLNYLLIKDGSSPIEETMIKGIVFDFDGTIVDSMQMVFNALNEALKKKSLPTIEAELLGRMAGLPVSDIISTKTHITESTAKEIERDVFESYTAFCRTRCQLLPHVENTLKTLKSKQIKIGLLTTTPSKPLKAVVNKFSLKDYFDIMIAKEDAKNKPNPEGLNKIITEFELKKDECLYVGDSPIDILTGKAAGIRTIAVTTGIATIEQLKEAKPDAIIPNLEKLLIYVN